MSKKKFLDQRRQKCRAERTESIDARDYRDSVVELLTNLGVEFETHWAGVDDGDDYYGFKLSYDPPWDRTWHIVKNPYGGEDLELAVEYGFDISFGCACWSFHPTVKGYMRYCEMISALLTGNAAAVSCLIDGVDMSHAILVKELMDETDMRLLDRIAERDYYGTEQDILYKDDFNCSVGLQKKLRKLRSRNGWSASYVFWNPQMNKVVEFRRSVD